MYLHIMSIEHFNTTHWICLSSFISRRQSKYSQIEGNKGHFAKCLNPEIRQRSAAVECNSLSACFLLLSFYRKKMGGLLETLLFPSLKWFCAKAKWRQEMFLPSLSSEWPRHWFCLWNARIHLLHIKVHSTFFCPLSSHICSTFPSLSLIFFFFSPLLADFKDTGKFTIACVTKTKKNKPLLFEDHQNNFWWILSTLECGLLF